MPKELSPTEALNEEHRQVASGAADACGAPHHTNPDESCMRVKDHETGGGIIREAHATLVTEPAGAWYWVSWTNLRVAPTDPPAAP